MGRRWWGPRLTVATIGVGATVALLAPASGAATADQQRIRPPRSDVSAQGVRALATPNSPWVVTSVYCGTPKNVTVQGSQYFTLYAYGVDGGDNGQGVKGGGGSVAVGAFRMPPGTVLSAAAGCKGVSATPTSRGSMRGGNTKGRANGGRSGSGTNAGQSGGGGGGFSGWYRGADALVEGGAGGGAGALTGGGAGGDGGHAGANGSGDATGGGGATWDEWSTAGQPWGNPGRNYNGGAGGSFGGIAGGGGGSGRHGGGGGGSVTEGGAGGGGGGSIVYTEPGYWVNFGGTGHGSQNDGNAYMLRVRSVVRHPSFASDIVRGVAANGFKGGGYVVDGRGNIKTFSQGLNPAGAHPSATWPGFDIARGIATLPDGTGGYTVDLYGALHPFTVGSNGPPPAVTTRAIWPGQDVARGVAILADGTGGYVLGRNGSMVAFAIGSHPKPPKITNGPSWIGQDKARGVTAPFLDAGGPGGYIVDSAGTLHPWGTMLGALPRPGVSPPMATRGILGFPGGDGGLLVDGKGNLFAYATPGFP